MSIDAATVRRIAHLARIKVEDGEIEHLQNEINSILGFVEQLKEVNVEGVEPMTSMHSDEAADARGQGDRRRRREESAFERAADRGRIFPCAKSGRMMSAAKHSTIPGE